MLEVILLLVLIIAIVVSFISFINIRRIFKDFEKNTESYYKDLIKKQKNKINDLEKQLDDLRFEYDELILREKNFKQWLQLRESMKLKGENNDVN